jgi:type IV pilus assembly protein PilV
MKTTRSRRGYTMVELMMALTVLAIGVSGVIAMQKVTIASNQHAKNLALATHIADAWAEQLAVDATRWNFPSLTNASSDRSGTYWLGTVNNTWLSPSYQAAVSFGPGFDALGNVVPLPGRAQQAAFCTHIRLSWLYPEASFNGLVRADIRVFWAREGRGAVGVCGSADLDPDVVSRSIENYHFVHHSTAIKQHTAFQ